MAGRQHRVYEAKTDTEGTTTLKKITPHNQIKENQLNLKLAKEVAAHDSQDKTYDTHKLSKTIKKIRES